jgi:hypothetical protein
VRKPKIFKRRFRCTVRAFIRWDEKGRCPAGCDTLPMIDALKAQEKETGYEED